MALTRKTDGTGTASRVTASWWNDFMDLLTGVMGDQPVTIANRLTANTLQVNSQSWLDPQTAFGSSFPTLTLALGDNDTGLNWLGDGHFQAIVNGGAWLDVQTGKSLGFAVLDGATPRLVHIYIGTTTPTSPVEGDIWIKG